MQYSWDKPHRICDKKHRDIVPQCLYSDGIIMLMQNIPLSS